MSYSTSTFSRVDKAWPAMSDSTQARIQRLREMEQIRLQKQAALFSQRNSNPIPMPKFESRITSSRPPTISDREQNKCETFVDESSSQDTGKSDEGEITVTSEIIEILTTDLPLEEESESKHNEGNVKEDISKYQQASHDNKTEVTKTVSEPSRTLSTSYISGPLSPTSSEKTRISVVRKMKLDSLPVVKTTRASESVTLEASNQETAVYRDSNRPKNEMDDAIVEVEKTDTSKLASSVDGSSIKSDTKSFLTLHEFKIQSGMNNSKSDEAVSIVDKNSKSSKKTSGDSVSEKLDNSNKPSENTETKSSTIQSSLKEEEIAIKETTVESSTISREKLSKPYTTVSMSSALSTSVQPSNPELDSTHIQELSDKDSTKSQKQSNSENTCETIISSAKSASEESNSCPKTISDTKTKSEKLTLDANVATSAKNKTPEPVLDSEDAKETVFHLGTLALKQNLEVHAKIDKQFSSVSEDVQSRMAKLEELQRQRQERKKALGEEEEDISHLPVRERFFRNQSSRRITRPVRQQSIPEQIIASRLSRRNSDYTRSGSPGKASEAESPPLARRSRVQQRSIDRLRRRTIDTVPVLGTSSTSEVPEEKPKPKPILDIDSLDKAFGRPDQERFNRLDELDRIRIQNREKRRDSAPSVSVDIGGSMNTRADFPSSLIVNRGSCENIAQFPIHEHLESSFPMSRFSSTNTVDDITSRSRELLRSVSSDRMLPSLASISRPILHSSYSDSTLFPLDGGRLSQSGILSMSTDTDHSQLQQGTNQQQFAIDSDNDDTPVYMNGTPQGTPLIDNEGKTHWVGPTSPRLSTYINVIDRLQNRTRSSSFDSNVPSFRHRAFDFSDSLLDAANQDHFLADCFLKKYTLKERCALIRDKIYGTKNSERGKPDGASHDSDKNKNR